MYRQTIGQIITESRFFVEVCMIVCHALSPYSGSKKSILIEAECANSDEIVLLSQQTETVSVTFSQAQQVFWLSLCVLSCKFIFFLYRV